MAEGLADIVGGDLRRRRTIIGLFSLTLALAAFLPQNQRALFGDRDMMAVALGVTPGDALRALLGTRVVLRLPLNIRPAGFVPGNLGSENPGLEEPSAFGVLTDPVVDPEPFVDAPRFDGVPTGDPALFNEVPNFAPPRFSDFARLPSASDAQSPTVAVPEPTSWLLMLTGFLGIGWVMRRFGRKTRTSLAEV